MNLESKAKSHQGGGACLAADEEENPIHPIPAQPGVASATLMGGLRARQLSD